MTPSRLTAVISDPWTASEQEKCEAVAYLRNRCAASNDHDYDGCGCTDEELLRRARALTEGPMPSETAMSPERMKESLVERLLILAAHERDCDDVPLAELYEEAAAALSSAQEEITKLRERCEAYKGQVAAGAVEIDGLTVDRDAAESRSAVLEAALRRIEALDEAMGHELRETHAFEAVQIARDALARIDSALSSSPSGFVSPCRCQSCGCHTYARVDEQTTAGYRPGPMVRCVSCKNISYYPEPVAAASGPEGG